MGRRNFLFLLSLGFLAVLVGFGSRMFLVPNDAAVVPPEPAGPEVLVLARDMEAGSFVLEGDVLARALEAESDARRYLPADDIEVEDLYGAILRDDLPAGSPLARSSIIKPTDRGFLAAVLHPGFRAVTVSINARSGNAGLTHPGDRVDVILTMDTDERLSGTERREVASETILSNIRVIAVGSEVDQRSGMRPEQVADGDGDISPVLEAPTATLEVLPDDVRRVIVAEKLGTLSLSLRSMVDQGGSELRMSGGDPNSPEAVAESLTWSSDVASALVRAQPPVQSESDVLPPEAESAVIIEFRGSERQEVER